MSRRRDADTAGGGLMTVTESKKYVALAVGIVGWIVLLAPGLAATLGKDPSWLPDVLPLGIALAVTGSLAWVVLATIPNLFEAWQRGVGYGQRHPAIEDRGTRSVHTPSHRSTAQETERPAANVMRLVRR